jgi:signal transduction histidine kinase
MTISLKNRLALTYTLFTGLVLGLLTLIINVFTGQIFTTLIRENIAMRSEEIVRDIGDQYNPLRRGFDALSIEAMGMTFVHEGYIVTVEDEAGDLIWDARACDMRECMEVINSITGRMEGRFGLNGSLRKEQYPVNYSGRNIGTVTVETYGPFFYSETETKFLASVNRLLFMAGIILILVSAGISAALSRAIARPIKKAGEAARQIAQAHAPWSARMPGTVHPGGMGRERPVIRIPSRYNTRELAELSRSLNELAAELEEAERRQKQLTADVAHELRTPLACLQGDIEAMIDGVYAPDRKHLESCHEEILRLAGLVQDLNTLSSLEWETGAPYGISENLHKTKFDLAKLLQITAEQFRAAANEKGITITLKLRESPVTADYDRLKQVFINLLANAVTYTDRGGITIAIEDIAGREAPGGGPLSAASSPGREITVADTGIGIPEQDLPHIFERLYRSDKSRSRGTGGAGIGLAIAAAIVHAHGGTISAESRGEETAGSGAPTGTVFRVAL